MGEVNSRILNTNLGLLWLRHWVLSMNQGLGKFVRLGVDHVVKFSPRI